MSRVQLISVLLLAIAAIGRAQQIDLTFCDVSNIVSDDGQNLQLPFRNNSEIYFTRLERNFLSVGNPSSGPQSGGMEISEVYDGRDNVGVAHMRVANRDIRTYTYVGADEFLLVNGDHCAAFTIEQSVNFSPFQIVVDSEGKKHIASPLTLISSNPAFPRAYLGSTNRFVRGIPVREWQMCAYSDTEKSTLRITVSYTNKDKWATAFHQLPGQESIPVQIRVDHKPADSSRPPFTEVDSVFEFKTNQLVDPSWVMLPSGVYCRNRMTQKKWPTLPTAFSFVAQLTIEQDSNALNGTVLPLRFEFDKEKKLLRVDSFNEKRQLTTAIEDLNTGLSYEINRFTGECKVSLVDLDLPKDIFLLDMEPKPELVGLGSVRGINTVAWIAPRNFSDQSMLMEWHFMAPGWASMETNGFVEGEPIAVYSFISTKVGNETIKTKYEYHVSNFDRTRIDLYDFDVANCHNVKNKHLRFSITDKERYGVIHSNQQSFREATFLTLHASAKVSLIRLSRLELHFEDEIVYGTFTLMDKSDLGNVKDENTLDEAYANLASDIRESKLAIKFLDSQNRELTVRPDSNSLTDLDSRDGRYIYNYIDGGNTIGTTAGVVILLMFVFLIVGLAIGIAGGVFIIIRRAINVQLPGPLSFFNPNFASQDSA